MSSKVPFIPYARQLIQEDDLDAVARVLKGDFLTGGPAVTGFEKTLADKTGAESAVACSSGTAALHLAALALGIGEGDRVVVPTITFLATANAARYVGAEVIFADVDPETGLMGPEELSRALEGAARNGGGDIKAVFPVHLAGQGSDLERIYDIAQEHGLAIVEDACHALGGAYGSPENSSPVGSCRHSDMTVFSFHPIKTVAMGEGGAITTNDDGLAGRLEMLRNHGMTRTPSEFQNDDMAFDDAGDAEPWYYEMSEIGFNYRASDIHCALGSSQLAKLDRSVAQRQSLVARYDSRISQLAPRVRPIGRTPGWQPGWHLYVALIDFEAAGISRGALMRQLKENDIGTQLHYIPVHEQPYYRQRYGQQNLPGAATYYAKCLSLPLYAGMEEADVDRVVDTLGNLLSGRS